MNVSFHECWSARSISGSSWSGTDTAACPANPLPFLLVPALDSVSQPPSQRAVTTWPPPSQHEMCLLQPRPPHLLCARSHRRTPGGRGSARPPQGGCLNSQRAEEPLDGAHACRAVQKREARVPVRAEPRAAAVGSRRRPARPPRVLIFLLSRLSSPPATRRPRRARDVSARSWGPIWVFSSSLNPTLLPALPPGWRPQPNSVSIASILGVFFSCPSISTPTLGVTPSSASLWRGFISDPVVSTISSKETEAGRIT